MASSLQVSHYKSSHFRHYLRERICLSHKFSFRRHITDLTPPSLPRYLPLPLSSLLPFTPYLLCHPSLVSPFSVFIYLSFPFFFIYNSLPSLCFPPLAIPAPLSSFLSSLPTIHCFLYITLLSSFLSYVSFVHTRYNLTSLFISSFFSPFLIYFHPFPPFYLLPSHLPFYIFIHSSSRLTSPPFCFRNVGFFPPFISVSPALLSFPLYLSFINIYSIPFIFSLLPSLAFHVFPPPSLAFSRFYLYFLFFPFTKNLNSQQTQSSISAPFHRFYLLIQTQTLPVEDIHSDTHPLITQT